MQKIPVCHKKLKNEIKKVFFSEKVAESSTVICTFQRPVLLNFLQLCLILYHTKLECLSVSEVSILARPSTAGACPNRVTDNAPP